MTTELTIHLKGKDINVVLGRDGEVVVDGKAHRVEILKSAANVMTLSIDGRVVSATGKGLGSDGDGSSSAARMVISAGGKDFEVEIDDQRSRLIKSFRPATAAKGGLTRVKAPMPGLVVRLEAEKGQTVKPGQGLLVLEAMKMENEIRSAVEGIVDQIAVKAGEAVEKDALLITIKAPETT
jgi:biotin carboxyl carrier protein